MNTINSCNFSLKRIGNSRPFFGTQVNIIRDVEDLTGHIIAIIYKKGKTGELFRSIQLKGSAGGIPPADIVAAGRVQPAGAAGIYGGGPHSTKKNTCPTQYGCLADCFSPLEFAVHVRK